MPLTTPSSVYSVTNSLFATMWLAVCVLFGFLGLSVASSELEIIVGLKHSCSIYDHGLRCWGSNEYGQLGIESTTDLYEAPESKIDLGDFEVETACIGLEYTCAKSTNGTTKCFGRNQYGYLGQGSTTTLGDHENEMGDYLPVMNWGDNFTVSQLECGYLHNCALSTDAVMKCIGYDQYGELGTGTGANYGNSEAKMGNGLIAVNLGDDFIPESMSLGVRFTCVLSTQKALKCWGQGTFGSHGQGNTKTLGDSASELGEALLTVDMGTGFDVVKIDSGSFSTCALSTAGNMKCFGYNNNGQLGLGDTENRGDDENEMGDYLPEIDFGTDFIVADFSMGYMSVWAMSTNGTIKAWGRGNSGSLGYGDGESRGVYEDDMQNLLTVDLGSDFNATKLAQACLSNHFCVSGNILTDSTSNGIGFKCWGDGGSGRLGSGDEEDRGYRCAVPVGMGDDLPFLDLGFTTGTIAPSDFQIIAGTTSTCSVNSGELRCWGKNDDGQLGIGNMTYLYQAPESKIDLGDNFEVESACLGGFHTCALSTTGLSKCFGRGDDGRLGQGSQDNIGDEDSEMGDWLPAINWGDNFTVRQLSCGYTHTCALSTDSVVKCIGLDEYGELGTATGSNYGQSEAKSGNNLIAVDLGTGFVPESLSIGRQMSCALSTDKSLKCWGRGTYGSLGQESTKGAVGDGANELGDYLSEINLGANFEISKIECGSWNLCALDSTAGQLKCWGLNSQGDLGLGDTTDRGGTVDSMGDYLIAVDLGTNFIVDDFSMSGRTACAISTSRSIKCFGQNGNGRLGSGDEDNRGDEARDMGDALLGIDVGTGFNVTRVGSKSNGLLTVCVTGTVSSGFAAKCWGYGANGQLGTGDDRNIGDKCAVPENMGNELAFVELGFTMSPTTASPTVLPTTASPTTASPTTASPTTASPTIVSPTVGPTQEPTDQCWSSDQHNVNWHDLLNEDDSTTLLHASDITFNASTLSLTFTASLEYVGLSADGNFDDDYNLGTTYWIDFQSFADSADGVDAAGTCGNREAEDYDDLDFANWWEYTANPMDLGNVADAERMAYPDSNWTFHAASGSCNVVEYERTFSWTQMTSCDDAEGNELIEVTETADSITLSGVFFVELVSPYSMSSDEYYRTYPLIQQDFAIVLDRQVDALASTGVHLFISTVMAYGRDDDGNYELTILVQSADYVKLGTGNDVTLIDGPWDTSHIQTVTGDGCLVASSFTCGQIFTATIPAECSADDNTVDLSGTYQFSFDPDCQTLDDGSDDAACTTFLGTVGEAGVVLDVDSSFTDNCDVDLFNVTFGADLTFYQDDAFTVEVGDDSDPYVIGQDTIYGKVLVDIAVDETDTMYTFVDVSIENIYVCTAEDTADLSLDSDSGLGGCLSSNIDADGPYVVYGDGAVTDYHGMTYDATGNEATFSFLTFDTPRTTINVHVQLLLTLVTDTGARRRMLLEADIEEGNAFRSFIGTASVQEEDTTADPVATDGADKVFTRFIAVMFAVTAYVLE